jgi:predicted transcriptional regulator
LLEVLFPAVRAEILRLLFSLPLKQRYVRELARMSGLALCTIQDELRKLSAADIVTSSSNRYRRFFQANIDHPLFPELSRMVQLSARLPTMKHSALHRPTSFRSRKKPPTRRLKKIPSPRAINWHLFERHKT